MFDAIKETFTNLVSNKKFLVIFLVTAIFIGAAIYVYKFYVEPRLSPSYAANKELMEDDPDMDNKTADLYFFKVDWCPHCKKAAPIWEELSEEYKNKSINGYKVNFIEVDCEKDSKTADQFKIEGYPTIKLVKDGQVIEYDAKPDKDTLDQFLNSTL